MPTVAEINARIPSHEQIVRKYPRLLRAMQWVAILNQGEAVSAIEGYLMNREFETSVSGPEAVAHFGGPYSVIQAAIRHRHITRRNNASR